MGCFGRRVCGIYIVLAAAASTGARAADTITLWNANTSSEIAYQPVSSRAKAGDFIYIDARKLHPTQICLGYREVTYKAGLVSAMKADKASHDPKGSVYAYLAKKDVPIILAPDGTAYLTDGHHTLAALLASTQADKTAFGHIVANFSGKPEGDFRTFMENPANNDIYLFGPEGNGLTQTPGALAFEHLPKIVYSDDPGQRMANDPYRSLGWGMKESGYSSKNKEGKEEDELFENFIEFRWADLFRGKIVWENSSDDAFYTAVANADALAHSGVTQDLSGGVEARDLPGFSNGKRGATFGLNITNDCIINGDITPPKNATNTLAINARTDSMIVIAGKLSHFSAVKINAGGVAEPVLEKGDFKPKVTIPAGSGKVVLAGESDYVGATEVSAGELVVNGALASAVSIAKGAVLEGSGRIGMVSGAGEVSPGNAEGILTAEGVDPAGGIGFAFTFSATQPVYARALNSRNDVLMLTSAEPFHAPLSAGNAVRIFLRNGELAPGESFSGGFLASSEKALTDGVRNASYRYFLADPRGSVAFGGYHYRVLDASQWTISVSAAAADDADATGGTKEFVTRFTVEKSQAAR